MVYERPNYIALPVCNSGPWFCIAATGYVGAGRSIDWWFSRCLDFRARARLSTCSYVRVSTGYGDAPLAILINFQIESVARNRRSSAFWCDSVDSRAESVGHRQAEFESSTSSREKDRFSVSVTLRGRGRWVGRQVGRRRWGEGGKREEGKTLDVRRVITRARTHAHLNSARERSYRGTGDRIQNRSARIRAADQIVGRDGGITAL